MIIIALALAIAAVKVDSIEITGNRIISKVDLLRTLQLTPGGEVSEEEIEPAISKVLREYVRRGYLFASIDYSFQPNGKEGTKLTLRVNEGKRVKIGNIRIVGNSILSGEEIKRALKLRGKFDPGKIEEGIKRVLRIYAEKGYPLARMSLTEFRLSKDRSKLNFDIMIDEGDPVRIADVRVTGLKKTKPKVILRQLPIRAGMPYRQSLVDESIRLLRNMPYIYDVEPKAIEIGERTDEVIFNAHVIEAHSGRIEGMLGYAPPITPESRAKLTGTIFIDETNILGSGRALHFEWRSAESKRIEFRYLEPWILGRPIDLSLRYERQAGFKSYGISLISRLNFRYLIKGGFSYEMAELNGMRNRAVKFEAGFRRDVRDYALNPTSGDVESANLGVTAGDYRLGRFTLGAQIYLSTRRNQVLALGAHLGKLFGRDIPPFELFSLGGANTLRGYPEGWFQGGSMAYANLEYRFLTGLGSHLFLFVDLGTTNPPQLQISYGVGARLEARSGRLNLCYGLARGDSILNGKIHVSLGTAF